MIAIDTNVVVRFVAGDDPDQEALAAACIGTGVFVSHGVLMEAEWVLRGSYGWGRSPINTALAEFLALREVETELPDELQWALDQHRAGADWADMLHLIAARRQSGFATFDRKLVRAALDPPVPVELLQ